MAAVAATAGVIASQRAVPRIIASRPHSPRFLAATGITRLETRIRFFTGAAAAKRVRLVFPARRLNIGFEQAFPNTFNLTCAVEESGVGYVPVTFGGQLTRLVGTAESQHIVADVFGDLPANATRFFRVGVEVTTGQQAPCGVQNWPWDGSIEQAVRTNGGASQVYATGAMLRTGAYSDAPIPEVGFGPIAVIGDLQSAQHSCLIFGDSIVDTFDHSGDSRGHFGWIARALSTAGIPHTKASCPGNRAARATPTAAPKQFELLRLRYATHVVINLGVNDIGAGSTLAALQADLLAIFAGCKTYGCKVYAALITPRTTSTDGWATEANQTFSLGHEPGGIRDQANDWLIAIASSGTLDGVVDELPYIESQANHGKWLAGKTSDGLHPGQPGIGVVHTAMAQAMTDVIATW